LPFKANADRRQHIPPERHGVSNWPDDATALRQRRGLTVWFTEAPPAGWRAEPSAAARQRR
jgi:hypothetical protein